MDADDVIIRVMEHVIDFENLTIRAPYKKLGKALYRRISDKLKRKNITSQSDTGITVRIVDIKQEKTNGSH